MFMKYPSTFHPIIGLLRGVSDPCDAAEVEAVTIDVNHQLTTRFREETAGAEEGPFRRDYASARLDGAVELLEDTQRLAVQAGACAEFLAVVDHVVKEARTALYHAVAATTPAPNQAPDNSPREAAWVKAALVTTEFNPLPEFLRDV